VLLVAPPLLVTLLFLATPPGYTAFNAEQFENFFSASAVAPRAGKVRELASIANERQKAAPIDLEIFTFDPFFLALRFGEKKDRDNPENKRKPHQDKPSCYS